MSATDASPPSLPCPDCRAVVPLPRDGLLPGHRLACPQCHAPLALRPATPRTPWRLLRADTSADEQC